MANLGKRIVVLIDMDCFFCQVETKLQPQYQGHPLAVVQYNQWKMGKIIAVNYEARKYGITRHMRGKEAKEICPNIILVTVPCLRGKADTSRYRKAGHKVIEVIKKHCNVIERASIDEAYLDITDVIDKRLATSKMSPKELMLLLANTYIVGYSEINKNDEVERKNGLETWIEDSFKELPDSQAQKLAVAGVIVEEIRADIYKETGFKCSAGISQNKILAKLACGLHKPNCQTILPEAAVPSFYSTLPVKKVRNLGGKFGDVVIESLGCNVMGDLLHYSLEHLQKTFDEKTGFWLYNLARGIDNEPVTSRLLAKSIGAYKTFPGKHATSEVLRHWAGDLAAEICERLEQDLAENHRRATLLIISYTYYQNGSTVSQTRSFTLNSYKPEKIASQCVDAITKSTQCPVTCMGINASKFVPAKESNSFLKFFKTVESRDQDGDKVNSEIDKSDNSPKYKRNFQSTNTDAREEKTVTPIVPAKESNSFLKFFKTAESRDQDGDKVNSEIDKSDNSPKYKRNFQSTNTDAREEKTVTPIVSKEKEAIKTKEEKSERSKELATTEDSVATANKPKKENKRIVKTSLNKCTEDSPTSQKVFKLIQVCNERDKNKRLSGVTVDTNDFQDSFFMNIYKTKKETRSDGDTVEESESEKEIDKEDAHSENSNDYNANSDMQEKAREKPSTSRACASGNNSAEESKKETSVQKSSVRLRDIFPNLNDIDSDILASLPAELQEEAKAHMNSRSKKQESVKSTRELTKSTRGRPSKFKIINKTGKKSNPLDNFLIKTDSSEHDVPLERCAECNQMIPLTRFSEHVDFHFAQNVCREINRPITSESGVKRKLGDAEDVITSVKRHMNENSV
ncbi:DNA polymerase eta isoform X2 [Pseudomyrmex gracilis]|nr:DNA polymerase eta isoform X2 [Pseudomyrmex gracilis]